MIMFPVTFVKISLLKKRESFSHFTSAILKRSWALPNSVLFLNDQCCSSVPPQHLKTFSSGTEKMWGIFAEAIGCFSYLCLPASGKYLFGETLALFLTLDSSWFSVLWRNRLRLSSRFLWPVYLFLTKKFFNFQITKIWKKSIF